MEQVDRLQRIIEDVRRDHAPDPRTAVFEIEMEWNGTEVLLSGATSEAAAAEALHRAAAGIGSWPVVRDEIQRLPLPAADRAHAVARAAVVPILAGPTIAETHVSQVVLGRRLTILRRDRRWLQCRCEDGYLGWVHRGYVTELGEIDARAWEIAAGGEACVSLGAVVRDGAGEVVVRLPWGARVVRLPDGSVQLPDGLAGEVEGTLVPLAERAERFPAVGERMVETGAHWLGAPYLWGGVTEAGVDCSGFVQAVFHLHGIPLPRDSDQQAHLGDPVEVTADFSNLRPGDLLFFAETPERISHVTMSIGGSRIIHSSLGNGGVRRNDLMGDLAYERELRDLFVCARRMV